VCAFRLAFLASTAIINAQLCAGNHMSLLDRLFSRSPGVPPAPATPRSIPAGKRVYAVGDIHGRADLLKTLLAKIDEDDAGRAPLDISLIFLGDLIDRGPDSRKVVEQVKWLMESSPQVRCLIGNHEDLLLRCHDGDERAVPVFDRAGGRETMISYGLTDQDYDGVDPEGLTGLIRTHIPADHISFMRGLEDSVRVGDYLFVHAGIKPGVPLGEQSPDDMRWIREKFTTSNADYGFKVIHGHSITETIDLQSNRIGIDTGAYATGKLTAIGLEGDQFWFIDTGGGIPT
jgi:serine/threonine protein phosphatase 1